MSLKKLKVFEMIDSKANDSLVVHNSGDENVAGIKNFSTTPTVNQNNIAINNTIVHIDGNETISGTKSFVNTPNVNGINFILENTTSFITRNGGTISNPEEITGIKHFTEKVVFEQAEGTFSGISSSAIIASSSITQPLTDSSVKIATTAFVHSITNDKADKSQVSSLSTVVYNKADKTELSSLSTIVSGKANKSELSNYVTIASGTEAFPEIITGIKRFTGKVILDKAEGTISGTTESAVVASSSITQQSTDSSVKIATTAFVQNIASTKVNQTDFNTLSSTVNTKVNQTDFNTMSATVTTKASITSPTFTGTPKAPTATTGTNTTQIATTEFVQNEINSKIAAADAMIYKGTLGTDGTITTLNTVKSTAKTGWTYKVITSGTYAGRPCVPGDMIICLTDGSTTVNATWTSIEGNLDGTVIGPSAATVGHVAVFNNANGTVIKDGTYTIATSVPSDAVFTDTKLNVVEIGNNKAYLLGTVTIPTTTITSMTGVADTDVYIQSGKITATNGFVGNLTGIATSATNATNAINATTAVNASSAVHATIAEKIGTVESQTIGDDNTPVYISSGTVTTTGKSFSNYVSISGGTSASPEIIYGAKTFSGHIKFEDAEGVISGTIDKANFASSANFAVSATTQKTSDASTLIATTKFVHDITDALTTTVSNKADISSPTFTGIPKAPTASVTTNTTQIATTTFVQNVANTKASQSDFNTLSATVDEKVNKTELDALTTVVSSKANQTDLDTLSTTVSSKANQTDLDALSTTVSIKANISSPTFTGLPTAPTATVITSTSQIATTEFVQNVASTRVSQSDFNTLSATVDAKANQTDLNSLSILVSSKASQIDLDSLTTVVSSKASQTDLDALSTTVSIKANIASPTFTGLPTAPTAAANTSTTQIATTEFVQTEINSKIAAADAMIYKGTLGIDGTITSLDEVKTTAKTGWTYKVITNGTYADRPCVPGDMVICLIDGSTTVDAIWTSIEGNLDGTVIGPSAATVGHVAIFDNANGTVIKDGTYTIATSVPSGAVFTDSKVNVVEVGNNKAYLLGTVTSPSTTVTGMTGVADTDVYIQSGKITATNGFIGNLAGNATTATKLGTTTVGDTNKPIYLNSGTATALSSNIGDANTPVYISSGALTSTGKSFSSYLPLAGGTITGNLTVNGTITGNLNGNATTATKLGTTTVGDTNKPIYLNSGTATTLSGNIGDANTPVYILGGALTSTGKSFSSYLPLAGGTITGNLTVNGTITGNLSGNATTATTATKLGTTTVGDTNKPIYLNAGTATALSGNIGDANTPVYVSGGALTSTNKLLSEVLESISQLSSSAITLSNNYRIYSMTITSATTFTFNTSGLGTLTNKAISFELYLTMSTVYSLSFPSSVSWINTPDFSSTGKYLIIFKSIDGGSTWLGNLEVKW